jgi:hypothetical protein
MISALQWIDSLWLDLVLIYWNFILFESILETSDSVQGQIICKLMGIIFWTELWKKETNDVYDVEWEKKLLNAN